MTIRVAHLQRRPMDGYHSIEGLFATLRRHMPDDIDAFAIESPYASRGLVGRLRNVCYSGANQADVNHITGDVHYLAYGLDPSRLVLTVHDCVFHRRMTGMRREVMRRLWYELPVKRASVVTVISEFTRQELADLTGVAAKNLRVIHDCVSESYQRNDREFNADAPEVLLIGTGENKNLNRVVQALAGGAWRLHVVGTLSESQRALLDSSGNEWRNSMNLTEAEMVTAYNDADAVGLVSLYEGFGMPIVEAQCVGRPVVTANVASMPEVAGDAALLVDPLDSDAIRLAFERLGESHNLRQELVGRGFENAKRFESATIAAQYAEVYRELA